MTEWKNLGVGLIVQASKPMRQPRDTVRFARACRMLDQIVPARPLCFCMGHDLSHHVKLVVPGEDHGFLTDRLGASVSGDLTFLDVKVHEALQDVQEAIALQHLVPQVGGFPVALHRRVARAPVVAPVERQEAGFASVQPCGHPRLVGFHGEMNQRAFLELEHQVALVPVAE